MPPEASPLPPIPGTRTTPKPPQPIIMVFNSKPRPPRQKRAPKPRKPSTSKKTFAFVHVSRPGPTDEVSRRLVKTHAMQDVLRRRTNKAVSSIDPRQHPSQAASQRCVYPSPRPPPSRLLTFPIQTEPYMLRLIHEYATKILPSSTPPPTPWTPLILTDPAIFHALLCTSAILGLHPVALQKKHMLASIRLVNARLPGSEGTSDATITAILFMAKAEYLQGNHAAWNTHVQGVRRIVEIRGGKETMPRAIREKMVR